MATVKDFLANDRFARYAGVELLTVEPGHAKARMRVTECHLNATGVCQGGALFTLADLAFAAAANGGGLVTVSIASNITFFRPAGEGYVYAEAIEVVDHHRVPFVEVRLTDEEGILLALFTASGYRKNVPLPVGE